MQKWYGRLEICPITEVFHYFSFRLGSESIVKLLIEHGANIELTNVIGATPLIVAASNGIVFFWETPNDDAKNKTLNY